MKRDEWKEVQLGLNHKIICHSLLMHLVNQFFNAGTAAVLAICVTNPIDGAPFAA